VLLRVDDFSVAGRNRGPGCPCVGLSTTHLNRVDELRDDAPTGQRLATWLHDTERNGLLSEAVAYPYGAPA
jgi:hypothetical protein